MDLSKHMLFQSVRLVGAVGIELVGQSLSLAESTALTPLHLSKTLPEHRILDTSWPRIFFHVGKAAIRHPKYLVRLLSPDLGRG
jgi:hypothetical protein